MLVFVGERVWLGLVFEVGWAAGYGLGLALGLVLSEWPGLAAAVVLLRDQTLLVS